MKVRKMRGQDIVRRLTTKEEAEAEKRRLAKLARLWHQGKRCDLIAKACGYNHGSSVSHAARRLGLPARNQKARPRAVDLDARHAEQIEMANLAMLKPTGPTPKWYRCEVCQGKSPTPVHAGPCARTNQEAA